MERDLHAILAAIQAAQGQEAIVISTHGLGTMRVHGRLDLVDGVCHVSGTKSYAEFCIPHVSAIEKPPSSLLTMWLK